MIKYSFLFVLAVLMLGVYSCNKDEVTNSNTSDTLSYAFNSLNDSIVTINFNVAGASTSQPRTWTINLNKIALVERFTMTSISSGSLTLKLSQVTITDTTRRPSFTMTSVKDSTRLETGPNNRLELVPSNFVGKGSVIISK